MTTAAAAAGAQVTPEAPAAAATAATTTPATTPTTPATGTPAATVPATTPAAATPTVPERYELAVDTADAAYADSQDLERIAATAKANGWTQETATAFLADTVVQRRATNDALYIEAQAHPEIGGANLAGAGERAKLVMDKHLPATEPDGARLRKDLAKLGLTNYSPLVVLLSRIGKDYVEDSPAGGGTGAVGQKSTEDTLWPDKP
jgi:hypothetical protein